MLGRPWAEVEGLAVRPDSGAVVDEAGRLVWLDVDRDASRMEVVVEEGSVVRLTFDVRPSKAGPLRDLAESIEGEVGPPADGAFYTAAQLATLDDPPPFDGDAAFDVGALRMTVRVPTAAGPKPHPKDRR